VCGIAGVVAADADEPSVEAQLAQLAHRGPDSWGVYARPGGVIGQTRLAIIDLVTGDPPITDESGDVGVVLNGEIYNYRELADGLRHDGHRLATRCDTEVIAHLAEDLQPVELARRLEGMFAFAVWDDRRRRLVVGRDRTGKKPLYYWAGGGRLVFGSEIKAVLAHPAVPRELDADAIPAYLTFGYVPTPRTFFAGIQSLPPGHVLTAEPGGAVRVERYWEPVVPGVPGRHDVQPLDLDLPAAARELRTRLTAAVERRLIADVPLGAFLSGGVDSSAVVGIMAELGADPLRTFTIGFDDDEGYDERPYARTVAQRFRTDHTEFVVKPDAVGLVEEIVHHHDQPFGDSSSIPTYHLAKLTREHVTVALCGDGGDELFAGYERFAGALTLGRYQRLPRPARVGVARALDALPAGGSRSRLGVARRFASSAQDDLIDAYRSWVSFVPDTWRRELLGSSDGWALDDYRRVWAASEGADLLDRLLDLNLRTYLLDDLLPKVDRMAMAHALEVRSPFLDRELLEWSFRLPRSARIKGMTTKRVLKLAFEDLLPHDILYRRKHGFGIPLDRWFRTDLRSYLEAMLCSGASRTRSYLKPDAIDRLVGEHQRGAVNRGDSLWTLLTLEVFLRREGW
jgi:asparagine synthase (glutamine-hydrolysing)